MDVIFILGVRASLFLLFFVTYNFFPCQNCFKTIFLDYKKHTPDMLWTLHY